MMFWLLLMALATLLVYLITSGRVAPGRGIRQARRDQHTTDGAREANGKPFVDPVEIAYPIFTLADIVNSLPESVRMAFTPAGMPCPKSGTEHRWAMQVRATPHRAREYYWKCRDCPATTSEREYAISQGWAPSGRQAALLTSGRSRLDTRTFLRDLDAKLEPVRGNIVLGSVIRAGDLVITGDQCQTEEQLDRAFNRRDVAGEPGYGNHPWDF